MISAQGRAECEKIRGRAVGRDEAALQPSRAPGTTALSSLRTSAVTAITHAYVHLPGHARSWLS